MNTHATPSITIYRPNQRHELGLWHTWVIMAGNVVKSKDLIWQLFKRDFFAAYKKSFIGMFWIFVSPITGIISWMFLAQTDILQPGDVGIPYPAYVMIGNTMWGLFMGFYGAAKATLSAGGGLLMQVKYPHEALLFKQLASFLANFSIGFGANIVILLIFGVTPSWKTMLLPFIALPLFFFGCALGLLVAMIQIVALDLNKIIGMAMGMWLWVTPIVYSDKITNPIVQTLIKWNPLTYLVCSLRDIMIYGRLYDVTGYAICAGISFLLFLISWRLFYVSEDRLIERMV